MSCTFRQNPSVRRELATFDGKIAWDITTGVISSTLAYAVYYDHNTASTRYVRYDPTQPGAAATSGRLFDSLPANDLSREPGMLYVPTVSAKPGERSLLLYPLGEAIGSPSVVGTLTDGSRVSQATFARTPGGTLTYAARVAAASGESYSGTIFESAGAPATTGSTFAENLTKTVAFSGTMMFGGSRYVSHRNNPGVHDPHRMYKMPATLPFSAGAASSRVVGPSNTMTLTAQPAANGVDWLLAVLTFDLTGADIRVARVHAGNVDTWTTGDAPAGYATSNVAEFPFGSWTWHRHGGDDFLMLIGSGVNASGLNIVALDSSGRVVVRSTGAAGALLSGLRIDNAAIAAMPDFSTASPRYLLQWAVQDQLTHKTTIYSDVLHCDVQ